MLGRGRGLEVDLGFAFSPEVFSCGARTLKLAGKRKLKTHLPLLGNFELVSINRKTQQNIKLAILGMISRDAKFSVLGHSVSQTPVLARLALNFDLGLKVVKALDAVRDNRSADDFFLIFCVNCDPELAPRHSLLEIAEKQIASTIFGVSGTEFDLGRIVVAFEVPPLEGVARVDVSEIEKIAAFSRTFIASKTSEATAQKVRTLLAGNPDKKSALDLLDCPSVDGLLLSNVVSSPEVFFAALEKTAGENPEYREIPVEEENMASTLDVLSRFRKAFPADQTKIFMAAVSDKKAREIVRGLTGEEASRFFASLCREKTGAAAFFNAMTINQRTSLLHDLPDFELAFLFASLARISWLRLVNTENLSPNDKQKIIRAIRIAENRYIDDYTTEKEQFKELENNVN